MLLMNNVSITYLNKNISHLFKINGLDSLNTIFNAGQQVTGTLEQACSRHHNRDVRRLVLKFDDQPVNCFIKRQWQPTRIMPRLTDLRTGLWRGTPINEWRGLHMMRRLGFDTAEPLALFLGNLFDPRSVIVTKALNVTENLDELLNQGQINNALAESLAIAVARLAKTIDKTDLAWRSFKAKHIYPEQLQENKWKLWLIDCEGVHGNARTKDKQRGIKTLIHSLASADNSGTFPELVKFYLQINNHEKKQ
jgi:hypothetical protein